LDGRCSKRFDNLEAVFYFLEGGCSKIFDNLEAVFYFLEGGCSKIFDNLQAVTLKLFNPIRTCILSMINAGTCCAVRLY
jgi:hypothetical protein